MRFELTQAYRSTPADIDAAYANADLYEALEGLPKLGGIEPLDRSVDGPEVRQRIRFRFTAPLPSAVTAVIDPEKLTWVQETVHDLSTSRTTFRLLPDHYPDRLRASGSFRIVAAGDGARRIVEGDLRVKALLVAGKVEGAIVSGLAEYLEAEAPRVDAWIARQAR